MHQKYLKETKTGNVGETVFERFQMDEVYRREKQKLIKHIEQIDLNGGKGYVNIDEKTIPLNIKKEDNKENESKDHQDFCPKDITDFDKEMPKINSHDLKEFLKEGGQVKDLINKHIFQNVVSEIRKDLNNDIENIKDV